MVEASPPHWRTRLASFLLLAGTGWSGETEAGTTLCGTTCTGRASIGTGIKQKRLSGLPALHSYFLRVVSGQAGRNRMLRAVSGVVEVSDLQN